MSPFVNDGPGDDELPDATLADMVRHLCPSWTPREFDRVTDGVNSTVIIDVDTPDGS